MEDRYPIFVDELFIECAGAIAFLGSDDAEAFRSVFSWDGEKTDFRDFVPFREIHVYGLGHAWFALPIAPRS